MAHKSFLDGLGDLGLAVGDKICRRNMTVWGKGRKRVKRPGVTCFTIRPRGLERAQRATEGRGASAFIAASDTAAARAARRATKAAARATAKAARTSAKAAAKASRKQSRAAVSEARAASRRGGRSRAASVDEYGNPIRKRKARKSK
jgi:hypothetical protein